MNQFYVSIIFLGITLIVVSLVWIVYDRKKSNDYSKQLDRKKEELINIIADAEQMIEELNKFSDYVVTRMDLKNEELSSNLKLIEEKLTQLDLRAHESCEVNACPEEKGANSAPSVPSSTSYQPLCENKSDLIIDSLSSFSASVHSGSNKLKSRSKEKVIPLNTRHKEVLQLADKGLTNTEIARTLSMGKGEIQLILEINK